ncbi:MAG TPA: hypothetical protein P5137_09885, partial [Candidatus Brocadiia bacterium]|nr:hypothetical protein [Candidatus Brocadiia bacterium]
MPVVSGGRSAYVIAVPDEGDAGRTGQAAALLQRVLAEAAGVKLEIVKESARPAGAPAFVLGKSRGARAAGLDVDKVRGWAYLIQV